MSPSATTATQNEGGCRQVPRLPRKVLQRHRRPIPSPSAPPEPAQCHKWTQNEVRCLQVPRLPRETKVDVAKCPACHAKCCGVARHQSQPSAISGAPAMQNEGRCLQVPRLPRGGCCQVPRLKCHGGTGDQSKPKRATRVSPAP